MNFLKNYQIYKKTNDLLNLNYIKYNLNSIKNIYMNFCLFYIKIFKLYISLYNLYKLPKKREWKIRWKRIYLRMKKWLNKFIIYLFFKFNYYKNIKKKKRKSFNINYIKFLYKNLKMKKKKIKYKFFFNNYFH